jgi:hypothetical protein
MIRGGRRGGSARDAMEGSSRCRSSSCRLEEKVYCLSGRGIGREMSDVLSDEIEVERERRSWKGERRKEDWLGRAECWASGGEEGGVRGGVVRKLNMPQRASAAGSALVGFELTRRRQASSGMEGVALAGRS